MLSLRSPDREQPVVRVFKESFVEFSEDPEADGDIAKSLTEETAQLLHQPPNEGIQWHCV